MPRNIFLVLSALLFIAIAALSLQNMAAVSLVLFGANLNAPLGAITFGAYALGLLTIWTISGTAKVKEKLSEQKQVEWQKQDEKLAVEVASDKIKQLEAKIQTLEVALKSALDKNKKRTES